MNYRQYQKIFCVAAYDLQDALTSAKREFFGEIRRGEISGVQEVPSAGTIRIGTHECLEVGKLFDSFIDSEVEEAKPLESEKNKLMKKIVETKSKALLEKNRSKFTKEELLFLENKLK